MKRKGWEALGVGTINLYGWKKGLGLVERKKGKGRKGKLGRDNMLTQVNVWQSHQHLRGEMVRGIRVLAGPGQGRADHWLDPVHVRFILFPTYTASMSLLFAP